MTSPTTRRTLPPAISSSPRFTSGPSNPLLNSRTPTPSSRRREFTNSSEPDLRRTSIGPSSWPGNDSRSSLATGRQSQAPASPFDASLHVATARVRHEWIIKDVDALREWLEKEVEDGSQGSRDEDEEVPSLLRAGVLMKDDLHRLDLARTIANTPVTADDASEDTALSVSSQAPPKTLSLFIKSLAMEKIRYDGTFHSAIFVGITDSTTSIGSRFAAPAFLWSSENEMQFSASADLFDVTLPPLSSLLEHKPIRQANSFKLVIQIDTPPPASPVAGIPKRVEVPSDMIDALNDLLDTQPCDVRFICVEHDVRRESPEVEGKDSGPSLGQVFSRKRIIFAHSAILKARSDYFKVLLSGDFSEAHASSIASPSRGLSNSRMTTLVMAEEQYDTVFWMLRFIYTNSLVFAPEEDPRRMIDLSSIDTSAIKHLLTDDSFYIGKSEWDFRLLPREGDEDATEHPDFDARTVSSVGTSISKPASAISETSNPRAGSVMSHSSIGSKVSAASTPASTTSRAMSRISSATASSATPTRSRIPPSTSASKFKLPSVGRSSRAEKPGSTSPTALGRPREAAVDPHSHPAPPAKPASALAIYMLAHRYRLDVLESLAKEQILSGLSVDNAMPILLITYRYDALHREVRDFVLDRWSAVKRSAEYSKCLDEIKSGYWGEDGWPAFRELVDELMSVSEPPSDE